MNTTTLKNRLLKAWEFFEGKLWPVKALIIHPFLLGARSLEEQEAIIERETAKFYENNPEMKGRGHPTLIIRCYEPGAEMPPYEFDDDGSEKGKS
jgi:hypothetical protein